MSTLSFYYSSGSEFSQIKSATAIYCLATVNANVCLPLCSNSCVCEGEDFSANATLNNKGKCSITACTHLVEEVASIYPLYSLPRLKE